MCRNDNPRSSQRTTAMSKKKVTVGFVTKYDRYCSVSTNKNLIIAYYIAKHPLTFSLYTIYIAYIKTTLISCYHLSVRRIL